MTTGYPSNAPTFFSSGFGPMVRIRASIPAIWAGISPGRRGWEVGRVPAAAFPSDPLLRRAPCRRVAVARDRRRYGRRDDLVPCGGNRHRLAELLPGR